MAKLASYYNWVVHQVEFVNRDPLIYVCELFDCIQKSLTIMHFYLPDWSIQYRKHQISALTFYSYIVDWWIYILILIIFMIYGTVLPPRYHEFLLQDTTLMHTYKTERETAIPMYLLILIAIILPIMQFFLCSICNRRTLSNSRKAWDIFAGLMALCGSMATQLMITCILKNICGLPRPDLISRCKPMETEMTEYGKLATVEVCENFVRNVGSTLHILQEGFRSFPSGHLSTVFCGMVITSLNLAGKLQIFDKRGISFKALLAISPIMVACFVSCTRISDNRHFLRDVIGGATIGTNVAIWFYAQYFPSVLNLENCGRAYPPRRIGVANFFNNVGGFWEISDTLPGAYKKRILNNTEIIPNLTSEIPDEPISTNELVDMSSNISFFNKLTKVLKDKYINLDKIQRLPL